MIKYKTYKDSMIIYYDSRFCDDKIDEYFDLFWHRLDGPAIVDLITEHIEYFINNDSIEPNDYWTHPLVIRYNVFGIES